jgi:hypothetical protein
MTPHASERRSRIRPLLATVWAAVAALSWCGTARAHVVPEPQFVRSGIAATFQLAVPNERPEVMTGFEVTVPDGLRIDEARPAAGWTARVDGSTATWGGGQLTHLAIETFVVVVDVSAEPGPATLETRQLYPSGAKVTWPAGFTVLPGANPSAGATSQDVGPALAVAGVVGLAVALGVALLAWGRRASSGEGA